MSTQLMKKADTTSAREGAEVYHGREICRQKVMELLQEVELPRGLLPVEEIEECGYVRKTGFVWMKRNRDFEYKYKTTGVLACYAAETTGYVEKGKMKKISGVKVRELMVWLKLTELSIENPATGMVYCKTAVGVGKNIPIRLWEEEYDKYMSKVDVKPPQISV